MKVLVEISNNTNIKIPALRFFQNIVNAAVEVEKLKRLKKLGFAFSGTVKISIVFVEPNFLLKLNKKLRNKKNYCSELSFGFASGADKNDFIPGEYLGEIFITAASGITKNSYAKDFLHALLHIFGYNHEGTGQKYDYDEKLMNHLEKLIFVRLKKIIK